MDKRSPEYLTKGHINDLSFWQLLEYKGVTLQATRIIIYGVQLLLFCKLSIPTRNGNYAKHFILKLKMRRQTQIADALQNLQEPKLLMLLAKKEFEIVDFNRVKFSIHGSDSLTIATQTWKQIEVAYNAQEEAACSISVTIDA